MGGKGHDEETHRELLEIITDNETKCMILLSGYDNELYQKYLSDWRVERYERAYSRMSNLRTETIWINRAADKKLEKQEALPVS